MKRWDDEIVKFLKRLVFEFGLKDGAWSDIAQERDFWRSLEKDFGHRWRFSCEAASSSRGAARAHARTAQSHCHCHCRCSPQVDELTGSPVSSGERPNRIVPQKHCRIAGACSYSGDVFAIDILLKNVDQNNEPVQYQP